MATTIPQLNNELKTALKKYILERKHIRTGALYKSVGFECNENNGELTINYTAKFYIQYLENREFVNDFFQLNSTNNILSGYVVSMIERTLLE